MPAQEWRILEQTVAIDGGPTLDFRIDATSAHAPALGVSSGTRRWLIDFYPGNVVVTEIKDETKAAEETEIKVED